MAGTVMRHRLHDDARRCSCEGEREGERGDGGQEAAPRVPEQRRSFHILAAWAGVAGLAASPEPAMVARSASVPGSWPGQARAEGARAGRGRTEHELGGWKLRPRRTRGCGPGASPEPAMVDAAVARGGLAPPLKPDGPWPRDSRFVLSDDKRAETARAAGLADVALQRQGEPRVIYNRETDRSRGFGFVTMSTVEEAEKAVEMLHRYDVNGRLLTVNKAAPRGSRVDRPPRQSGPSLRIYVGNLPWQVDDSRLVQLFSEHGKVVDARVVYDRESGRSRGFGFVTMATQDELDDAIAALDGQFGSSAFWARSCSGHVHL
ncbi:unnamed protein product [Miscanthus lutarioriparius]|uniref:RRM domain-containing protein n=1 Tax=Miscanthus lutarioriparius TaxID=422564 RepID=A0A811NRL5_9POAL|nr:unnamed protein product [Miscanthus lutarioriparius]